MSLRRFLTAVLMFAISAVFIAAFAQPSFAQEEEDTGPNYMSRLFGSLGLLALPKDPIDTSERPPLVVPPMSNYVQPSAIPNQDLMPRAQSPQNPWDFNAPREEHLPPSAAAADNRPQQSVALPLPMDANTVRQRNPDFPVDPEIRAAQKKKKKKGNNVANSADDQWDRLRPDQLRSVSVGPKSRPDRPGTDRLGESAFDRASPQELNAPSNFFGMFKGKKEEPMVFQGEPERQTLTQPPSGYMTPSANAPYGIVRNEKEKPVAGGHQNSPNVAPTAQ